MKKLLIYLTKKIESISEAKKLIDQRKSFRALCYIGSVTQLKEGKLFYEGIKPEFKRGIQELVEEIIVKRESKIIQKEAIQITTKDGRVLKEILPYLCKPSEPEFLDTLHDELLRGRYQLLGNDIFTEVSELEKIKK